MGRKKIKIKEIENDRQKNVTFARRRCGLIKKAHELSVLCDCRVVLLMFDNKDACHLYSSGNADDLIDKFHRRDFKTFDRNNIGKQAVVNDYRVSVTGDGSEDITVCQIKHHKHTDRTTAMDAAHAVNPQSIQKMLNPACKNSAPTPVIPSAPIFFPPSASADYYPSPRPSVQYHALPQFQPQMEAQQDEKVVLPRIGSFGLLTARLPKLGGMVSEGAPAEWHEASLVGDAFGSLMPNSSNDNLNLGYPNWHL